MGISAVYGFSKSLFARTRKVASEIDTNKGFGKVDMMTRTNVFVNYCSERWWSDRANESILIEHTENDELLEEQLTPHT